MKILHGKHILCALVSLTCLLPVAPASAQKNRKSKTANTATASTLVWSQYKGSFQQFINLAIASGSKALLDKDITLTQTITVNGDLSFDGSNHSISHAKDILFLLGKGNHRVERLNIIQLADNSNAFYTVQEGNITWNNVLKQVNITGGENGYFSARGGVYDSKSDSVLQWAGTTIENCVIKVKGGMAISIYSQDGPCKYLHLRNVQLGSEVTHNIYTHPNVSMTLDSVVCLYAGKLALHYFSGGNDWMYYTARYFTMNHVSSLQGAMWEMVRPKNGCIRITNCDIAPYTLVGVEVPHVCAENTRFFNAGNGAKLSGTLINCSGTVWSAGPDAPALELKGGVFDEVNYKAGGSIRANGATINRMLVGEKDLAFDGDFEQCKIAELEDYGMGKGRIKLKASPVKKNTSQRSDVVNIP